MKSADENAAEGGKFKTGQSEKDNKKLTLMRHVMPRDFRALAELFANMAGVKALILELRRP